MAGAGDMAGAGCHRLVNRYKTGTDGEGKGTCPASSSAGSPACLFETSSPFCCLQEILLHLHLRDPRSCPNPLSRTGFPHVGPAT